MTLYQEIYKYLMEDLRRAPTEIELDNEIEKVNSELEGWLDELDFVEDEEMYG